MRKPLRADQTIRAQARTLRQRATRAETLLWHVVRNRRVGNAKWRRQHPIGSFIVDFYCAEHRLVLEVDGGIHTQQTERDAERTAWLQQAGYRVVRFTNGDVEQNIEAVLQQVETLCR